MYTVVTHEVIKQIPDVHCSNSWGNQTDLVSFVRQSNRSSFIHEAIKQISFHSLANQTDLVSFLRQSNRSRFIHEAIKLFDCLMNETWSVWLPHEWNLICLIASWMKRDLFDCLMNETRSVWLPHEWNEICSNRTSFIHEAIKQISFHSWGNQTDLVSFMRQSNRSSYIPEAIKQT
jgi:hypothetical protein